MDRTLTQFAAESGKPVGFVQEDLAAISQIVGRSNLSVDIFEQDLAQRVGVKQAVTANVAGMAALMAVEALDLGTKDEVILSPFTSTTLATAFASKPCRIRVADCSPLCQHIDLAKLGKLMGKRTKVIAIPHVLGSVTPMEEIVDLAMDNGAVVLEEVGGMLGCHYSRYGVGALGHLSFVDFSKSAAFPGIVGGAVLTSMDVLGEKLRSFRRGGRHTPTGVQTVAGFDCRMTAVEAVLCQVRYDVMDASIHHLTELAGIYSERFHGSNRIQAPEYLLTGDLHCQYGVRVDFEATGLSKFAFLERLRSMSTGEQHLARPLPAHPFFQQALRIRADDAPNSEIWHSRMLPLPLRLDMTEDQAIGVAQAVRELANG